MTPELVYLIAAFVIFLGWIFDILLQEDMDTALYVHLTDGKWRNIPNALITLAEFAFDRIFGSLLSWRGILIVSLYSFMINLVIMSPVFGITIQYEIVPELIYTFLFIASVGIIHDYVSLTLTRLILRINYSITARLIVDIVFTYAVLVSSMTLLYSAYLIGYSRFMFNHLHEMNWDSFIYIFEAYYTFLPQIALNPIEGGTAGHDHWIFMSSATTLFPTLCYVALLLVSIAIKLLLMVISAPLTKILDWLSRLPKHRIGLIMTGLGAFIALVQAWTAYWK